MAEMKYANVEYVDKALSRIVFGSAIPGLLAGQADDKLLDAAFAAGINAFDTARNYQKSENALGDWIGRKGLRDKIVLISKCAHHNLDTGKSRVTPKDIREDLAQSLDALQTDWLDVYLLHRDDPAVEVGPIVEVMNELRAEGKIRAFGASNWTHQRIQLANDYAKEKGLQPFTISSPNFGLASQKGDPWGGGCVTISGVENHDAQKWYREHHIPVLAYSSLGRGMFSGKVKSDQPESASQYLDEVGQRAYATPENFQKLKHAEQLAGEKRCSVAQIAMAWLFQQPMMTFSVLGTTKAVRFSEAIEALHIPLSTDEIKFLNLEN